MKSRSLRGVVIVVVFALVVFTIACITFGVLAGLAILAKLPEPMQMSFAVPPSSEVIPRSQVQPGTFKIFKAETEILEKAQGSPEKLTVAWGTNGLEYWFPKEGTAAFYYSYRTPETGWGSKFKIDRAELKKSDGVIIFYPEKSDHYTAPMIFGFAITGMIACLCIFILFSLPGKIPDAL